MPQLRRSTKPDFWFNLFQCDSSLRIRSSVGGWVLSMPGLDRRLASKPLIFCSASINPCGLMRAETRYFHPSSSASRSYSREKLRPIMNCELRATVPTVPSVWPNNDLRM